MKDLAKVIAVEKGTATVEIERKDECAKCGMCLFPKNANSIKISALNVAKASVGDTVVVESKNSTKLLGSVLVFLIPLILIALSLVLGYLFIENEIITVVVSLFLIALWYIILTPIDNKLKRVKRFCPEITEIIPNGENENE